LKPISRCVTLRPSTATHRRVIERRGRCHDYRISSGDDGKTEGKGVRWRGQGGVIERLVGADREVALYRLPASVRLWRSHGESLQSIELSLERSRV